MATLSYYTFDLFLLPSLFICTAYSFVVKLFSINNSPLMTYYNISSTKFKKQVSLIYLTPLFFISLFNILFLHSSLFGLNLLGLLLVLLFGLFILGQTQFTKPTYVNMYDSVVPLTMPFLLYFILTSSNFVQFLLLIEIIGYTFYFQFFNVSGTKVPTKFMDLLLYYYWSSFLGTICLFIGVQQLLLVYNTCDFVELSYLLVFFSAHLHISLLLFLGLLFKLGAVGVHFLKADFYKYISPITLFNFSVLSSFIYIYIFVFIMSTGFFLISPLFLSLFLAFLIFGLLIFATNIKFAQNLTLLFGYSAVLTVSTIFLLFL